MNRQFERPLCQRLWVVAACLSLTGLHAQTGPATTLATSPLAVPAAGTFLGQKLNPVLSVELDATPTRAQPAWPAGQSMATIRAESAIRTQNAPMYTGLESSQSMGATLPTVSGMDWRQDNKR